MKLAKIFFLKLYDNIIKIRVNGGSRSRVAIGDTRLDINNTVNDVLNIQKTQIIKEQPIVKDRKSDSKNRTIGAMGGYLAASLAWKSLKNVGTPMAKWYIKTSHSQDANLFLHGAIKALSESPLKDAGLKFYDASNMPVNKVVETQSKKYSRIPFLKKAISKMLWKKARALKEGELAMFSPKKNVIMSNFKKHTTPLFHELGHAHTRHFGKLGKLNQICRIPIGIIMPLMLGIGLRGKVEAKDNKPLSLNDKINNFCNKHLAGVTMGLFAPILIEEGLASIKGIKIAKKYLPSQNVQTLKKLYPVAWLSYFYYAARSTATVLIGAKVADLITEKLAKSKSN